MKIRTLITLDIDANGVDQDVLLGFMQDIIDRAWSEGLFTGSTPAKVVRIESASTVIATEGCPDCNCQDDFDGQEVVIDGHNAYQECVCNTCGASRTDTYALIRQEVKEG